MSIEYVLFWNVVFVHLALMLGMVYWLGKHYRSRAPQATARATVPASRTATTQSETLSHDQVQDQQHEQQLKHWQFLLGEVHGVAVKVAADIGQHSSRMEQIDAQLAESEQAGKATERDVHQALEHIFSANRDLNLRLHSAERTLIKHAALVKRQETITATDPLTGILSRDNFERQLAKLLEIQKEQDAPLWLVFLTPDYFEESNGPRGPEPDDVVLKGIVRVLRQILHPHDILTRYGNHEFALILPNTYQYDIQLIMERLFKARDEAQLVYKNQILRSTISIGLAEASEEDDADSLVSRVQQALRTAKQNGRNCAYAHNGSTCVPVLDLAPKANANDEIIHETERYKFNLRQRMAPYNGKQMPSAAEFQEIHCRNLSREGLSFYSTTSPDWTEAIIELTIGGKTSLWIAKRTTTGPIADGLNAGYHIECKFMQRISTHMALSAPGTITMSNAPQSLT